MCLKCEIQDALSTIATPEGEIDVKIALEALGAVMTRCLLAVPEEGYRAILLGTALAGLRNGVLHPDAHNLPVGNGPARAVH